MSGIDSLITNALKRHGIAKQVTSAMVVESSRRFFKKHLSSDLENDLSVISFNNGVLIIDCKQPAIVRLAQSLTDLLKKELTCEFPTLTVDNIFYRQRSESFNQPEHW